MSGHRRSSMDEYVSWLSGILREGESHTVEFKRMAKEPGVIAREIAAMANASGGTIVVGVTDDGRVIGLTDSELNVVSRAVRIATDSLFPSTHKYTKTQTVPFPEGYVFVIEVPIVPATLRPLRTTDGTHYRRSEERIVRVSAGDPVMSSSTPARAMQIFVAMSFQVEKEPALVDYYEAIKRAAGRISVPHHIRRVDEIDGDYEITQKIEEEISSSDLVIADFTLSSPNVYYEAGIARGAGVYTIRLARKDTVIPFDVGNKKFILYANATQLEAALLGPLKDAYSEAMKSRKSN